MVVWSVVLQATITTPAILVALLVSIWAFRLGAYLLIRIQKLGRDDRFDTMRSNFVKFAGFWLLQGLTVWVVLLPSMLFIINETVAVSPLVVIGAAVWLVGLLAESFADWQLYTFITNAANKGRWIQRGLWRYSRHPNYFGEITVWVGVYLIALSGLSGASIIIALLGPAYIAGLLLFVSGIPTSEKSADKRWGNDKQYQDYKRRTSVLIPLPPKK